MIVPRAQTYQPVRAHTGRAVDLKGILSIVFRRRHIIFSVVLPIIFIATIGTLRSTDVVTARSRVLIEASMAGELSYRSGNENYDEIMATAAQIVMSVPVSEKAATALLDSVSVLAVDDPEFAGEITVTDLRDVLLGGVDCGQVGESRILNIAFSDANPRFSLMAVGALTDAFIEYNIESGKNLNATSYYEEQIALVHAEIDSLMAIRAGILNDSGYSTFRFLAQTESNFSSVMDLDYQRAKSRRMSMEESLRGVRAAIKTDPEFVPITDEHHYPLLIGAKSELMEARTKLAELQVRYTEDYGLVTRQEQLVEVALQVFFRERDNFVRKLEIRLDEAFQVESVFNQARAENIEALANFPDIEMRVDSINLQIDTRRELLKSLQLRRGEVRLASETDVRISNIIRLDEPLIEMSVTGGKKVLYLMLATVFAIVLGMMVAIFIENQDHRLYDIEQVETRLEVPVIGAISAARKIKG